MSKDTTENTKEQSWDEVKQEIITSIAKSIDPEEEESWGSVVEHVRNKLMSRNGKLMKLIFYYQTLRPFVVLWVFLSAIICFFPVYPIYLYFF